MATAGSSLLQGRSGFGYWLSKILEARGAQLLTSQFLFYLIRWLFEIKRRLTFAKHAVTFWHRVDDPYAHLMLQVLPRLVEAYDVVLKVKVIPLPLAQDVPEPQKLANHAARDCGELSRRYGLTGHFENNIPLEIIDKANRILIASETSPNILPIALEISKAVWSVDESALNNLETVYGTCAPETASSVLVLNQQKLKKDGHYLSGMLHCAGEWYWSIDRLHYLTTRLDGLGAAKKGARLPILAPLPSPPMTIAPRGPKTLEFFFSFRSPYSYLALERTLNMMKQYPTIKFVIRPVLPMVMRGLPVPIAKVIYITLDCKREANTLGLPYGFISDPVGFAVERVLAVYWWTTRHARDRSNAFILSAMRGIWSEGIDAGSDHGLRQMMERVGLLWSDAPAALADETWREQAQQNSIDLNLIGMWGPPSYKIGDFVTWGQDRIWLVKDKLDALLQKEEEEEEEEEKEEEEEEK